MATIDTVKITQIGNSLGIILSKEILAKLNAEKGDTLMLINTANGIELSQYNKETALQMDIGREVMKEYRDVLKKLAE